MMNNGAEYPILGELSERGHKDGDRVTWRGVSGTLTGVVYTLESGVKAIRLPSGLGLRIEDMARSASFCNLDAEEIQ